MSMQRIIADLERLRARSRAMLLAQRIAVLLAWTVSVLIAMIGIDYLLRLPSGVRLVLLVGGLGVLGWAVWTHLLGAIRFRPTLTQMALRVERVLPALAGRLASSVEFAAAGVDQSNFLAARSVQDTSTRMSGESVRHIMRPGQTVRDVGLLVAVIAASVLFVTVNPTAAQTGVSRILLPYGSAAWPNRTGVQSLMNEVVYGSVHPRGQTLPLRAEVTRGDVAQRVDARYRVQVDGQWRPWRHVVLTQQGSSAVHERLVDANADAIEVYFSTHDDQTQTERIAIVEPPAVHRAMLRITPPDYAAAHLGDYEADLGPGTDSRAITERPSLIGSHVELTLRLNKPLPAPDPRDVAAVLGWDGGDLPHFNIDAHDASRWTLRWPLSRTRDLSLWLTDEHGLSNTEPITYRIEAVDDHLPSVTIVDPQADQPVLATAVVPVLAEAQDDVAIARMALEARLQPRNSEDEHEPLWSIEENKSAPAARLASELELAPLNLSEGDVLLVRAVAKDVYVAGETREPVYSPARRLRIISELDFASQMRRQLGAVRQNAVRIEALQAELQDAIAQDGVQPGTERAQAQLSERIAAQAQAVDELREQMQRNRLQDDQLASLFDQSRDLLDFAGRAATRAVQEIGEAREAGPDADTQPVTDAQQDVREELADLIELLDRDEDTWVVTRRLEGLLAEQSRLQEQTSRLHEQTIGQSIEELSEADLTELDRIARAQRDLRDEARRLVEELRRRAEALQDADAQSSSGMRSAADTAEQSELDRDMESASEQARQNQLRSAQASQQGASQTLQRMLQDIEQTQRARVEELLRQLASLVESIDRLIFVQENELSALANAQQTGDYTGRDRAMIRLNQNTQSVAGEARAAGQQARRIARSLDRAADAQGAAVVALRAQPLDHDAAEEAEERSLELLREARELAEQLQEQAREEELRRQREELIAAYREIAERQVMIREDSLELVGHERLSRRQLVEARRLGTQQDDIRIGLEDLQRTVRDIVDSPVFSHVHRRIDGWSRTISDRLAEGDVDVSLTDRQAMIAQSIGRLIEALEESIAPPDEFAQDQQDGGGGEGGGGGDQPLIPPITELRLLRGLQEEVYNHTRQVDSRDDLTDTQRREQLRELGQIQRELLELGQRMLEQLQQQ